MNRTVPGQLAAAAAVVACLVAQTTALAQNAYVANEGGNTVSVIDTATNTVIGTLPASTPVGVAVSPDGSKAYVGNAQSNSVSVIDTATNTITSTIPVDSAFGVAVAADGSRIYVTASSTTLCR
jgi:YVTN family beta-propeller protein